MKGRRQKTRQIKVTPDAGSASAVVTEGAVVLKPWINKPSQPKR